jgi:lipid-A-disaccharide synthase
MLIAGEASGDRIAARAIREMKQLSIAHGESVQFIGIGGDECEAEGMLCTYHARDMSVVGFVEVLRRASFFRNALKRITAMLSDKTTRPDTLVLIDYPGFNIRLAREAKKLGIRIVYYVSPQVWAWHKERVHELKKLVDEMLVIFPFEEKIYRDAGLANAHFVGHPLVEMIDEESKTFSDKTTFAAKHGLDPSKEWLLIFSGSRSEEVRRLLPTMSTAALELQKRHGLLPLIVESPSLDEAYYSNYAASGITRFRVPNVTHELMHHATLGLLKSGTTTLEAALLGLPGVICYKTHPLTYAIGKRVVKLPYIGLANIVIGRKLYPELLQHECNAEMLVKETEVVLDERVAFRDALEGLSATLRSGGIVGNPNEPPSRRVARAILQYPG